MSFANTKLDGANGRALAPLSDGAKSMPPRYYSHVNEKLVCVCITYGGWNLCGESRLGNIGERLLHIETLYIGIPPYNENRGLYYVCSNA